MAFIWIKRIAITGLILVTLTTFGLYRLNSLNATPIQASNFSWANKAEIYALGLISSALAYPIYPEVAREQLMIYSAFDQDPKVIEDDFFLRSKVVQRSLEKAQATNQPVRLAWPASTYRLSFDEDKYWEARTALALNGGYVRVDGDQAIAKVKIAYPPKSFAPLFTIPGLGIIGVEEGLFWLLQQEGWFTSGYVEWVAPRPFK